MFCGREIEEECKGPFDERHGKYLTNLEDGLWELNRFPRFPVLEQPSPGGPPVCKKEWDDVAGISTFHLFYMLTIVLPAPLVGWKAREPEVRKVEQDYRKRLNNRLRNFNFVGSFFEGLNIPRYLGVGTTPFRGRQSDLDTLVLMVGEIGQMDDHPDTDFAAYLELDKVHPGYARLRVPYNPNILTTPSMLLLMSLTTASEKQDASKINYVSSSSLRKNAKQYFEEDGFFLSNSKLTDHGPAITIEPDIETGNDSSKFDKLDGFYKDLVPAYHCRAWPTKLADNLRFRARQSKWLTPKFVESIVKDGCEVVPVSHKKSQAPDLEWRLSFSLAEVRIARELITDKQRQIYIFFKALVKQVMKKTPKTEQTQEERSFKQLKRDLVNECAELMGWRDPEAEEDETTQEQNTITSYHCKTIFLYSCEKLPLSKWEKYPGSCILYMLDTLIKRVRAHNLPSYFVPERNIIDHINEDEVVNISSVLESLRNDPISSFLSLIDTFSFVVAVGKHTQSAALSLADCCDCTMCICGSSSDDDETCCKTAAKAYAAAECNDSVFRDIIEPVIEDSKQRCSRASLKNSIGTVFRKASRKIAIYFAKDFLNLETYSEVVNDSDDNKFDIDYALKSRRLLAIGHLIELHKLIMTNHLKKVALDHLLNEIPPFLPKSADKIGFYEVSLTFAEEYQSILNLRVPLACMYYAAALTKGEIPNPDYLKKSNDLFEVLMSTESNKLAVTEYMKYLCRSSKIKNCIEILYKLAQDGRERNSGPQEDNKSEEDYAFFYEEKYTNSLRKRTSYAHSFLLKCIKEIHPAKAAQARVPREFDNICDTSDSKKQEEYVSLEIERE